MAATPKVTKVKIDNAVRALTELSECNISRHLHQTIAQCVSQINMLYLTDNKFWKDSK